MLKSSSMADLNRIKSCISREKENQQMAIWANRQRCGNYI